MKTNERGFTMVELMVTMVISLFGSMALLALHVSIAQGTNSTAVTQEAINIGNQTVEELRTLRPTDMMLKLTGNSASVRARIASSRRFTAATKRRSRRRTRSGRGHFDTTPRRKSSNLPSRGSLRSRYSPSPSSTPRRLNNTAALDIETAQEELAYAPIPLACEWFVAMLEADMHVRAEPFGPDPAIEVKIEQEYAIQ